MERSRNCPLEVTERLVSSFKRPVRFSERRASGLFVSGADNFESRVFDDPDWPTLEPPFVVGGASIVDADSADERTRDSRSCVDFVTDGDDTRKWSFESGAESSKHSPVASLRIDPNVLKSGSDVRFSLLDLFDQSQIEKLQ